MFLCIGNVLNAAQLQQAKDLLRDQRFESGSRTAGWAAAGVKNNEQLDPGARNYAKLQQLVFDALMSNELFALAAMPKAMRPILFNRYQSSQGYGDHVDNALMGEPRIRSDVSFTVFLSSPEEYTGGELAIEDMQGTQTYKLDAGAAVLYPSEYLHRVEPVTAGVRHAAVGWVQSLIRDPRKRTIIFELESVKRQIFQQHGKTAEFDSLSKSVSNLWRMWADP